MTFLLNELKVLYALTMAPIRGQSHAERLQSFYSRQASGYDAFRARLLQGRRELWEMLPVPAGGVWVDLGGGTAANLEHLGDRIHQLQQLYVVDLTPALLEVAEQRVQRHGWNNVTLVQADATTFRPDGLAADVVTFSYALTMIPEWFAAVDQARQLLRPGGTIGIVDFYVARKHPLPGQQPQSWLTRLFWPWWFGIANVFLNPDHIPYVHRAFEPLHFSEHRAPTPYLPGLQAPYYLFIGRKAV